MRSEERYSVCCEAGLIMDEGKGNTAMCAECKEWTGVITGEGIDDIAQKRIENSYKRIQMRNREKQLGKALESAYNEMIHNKGK